MQLGTTEHLNCELLHGRPDAFGASAFGPVAVFRSECLVGYRLDSAGSVRLFVFRTLAAKDPLAAWVPGVHPGVRLLMHVPLAGPIERVRWLFADLKKRGSDPSRLSDLFYARLSHVLGGGQARRSTLRKLVALDTAHMTPRGAVRRGVTRRKT